MLLDQMKSIIKYIIQLDIDYLETFLGYKGDNVLRVTTQNKETLAQIKSFLDNLGLEYKSEYHISGKHDASYNLYVGVEDSSVFQLKRDR